LSLLEKHNARPDGAIGVRLALYVEARKPTPEKFQRFPASLCQLAVRLFYEAEIVGAIDGRFLQDIEDLANDIGRRKGSQALLSKLATNSIIGH
jgi:hypothetical protein